MRAKIFVNGRFLSQRRTGVQRYAYETLRALDALLVERFKRGPPDLEVCVLAPPDAPPIELEAMSYERVGPLTGNAWEQLTLPWMSRAGLLVSFAPTGPIFKRQQIVTIHDAAVHVVPEAFSWKFRAWYRVLMPLLARRGPCVMTVSEFSKAELIRHFGARPGSVRVSGEGHEHVLQTAADPGVLVKHGLRRGRYVLAVGSLTPHKNFAVIARAFARLRDVEFDVAVAGALDRDVFGHIDLGALSTLKLLGPVSDAELRALYEGAAAFVYPSLYEGFGIPPLEAMALGCPVIASRAGAIPEVCGEAALYFAPHDDERLSLLIRRVVADPSLRRRLVARGREQVQRHRWSEAARSHLAALQVA
jgi:glycosyltransferase involved in cell wall biosynthesis